MRAATGSARRRFRRRYFIMASGVALGTGIVSSVAWSATTTAWLVAEMLFWAVLLYAFLDPADPHMRRGARGPGAPRDKGADAGRNGS